jgi:glutathione synthase
MHVVVVMDEVALVSRDLDTSFGLMLAAQERGHRVSHCLAGDLYLEAGDLRATVRDAVMSVEQGVPIALAEPVEVSLEDVDAVLVRPDPPFDTDYLTLTLLLEGLRGTTFVMNDPRGLREANEKLYSCRFPDLMPPTVVTSQGRRIEEFVESAGGAVLKPIDGHGGKGIRFLQPDSLDQATVIEAMTDGGRREVMVQEFLPAVYEGDKRILLLDGDFIGAINRRPRAGEFRANIGLGGTVHRTELDAADRQIIDTIAASLRADGLWFVGIDVIGGRLIEINVTSPTGIRQVGALEGTRPDLEVIEWVERQVA